MSKLDRLVVASGVAAAIFLALIGVVIAAQIIARQFGHQIPAADDFAAWSMAGSIFLALPYAMLRGDHIRVTLLMQFLPKKLMPAYETLATLFGFVLCTWAAWNACIFVYESFEYNEVAQGMLRVPMWIPQLCMPIGLVLLAAVVGRRLIACLRGEALETSHG